MPSHYLRLFFLSFAFSFLNFSTAVKKQSKRDRDPPSPGVYKPTFSINSSGTESPSIQKTIDALKLQKNIEGGYYVETDRDSLLIPNPFAVQSTDGANSTAALGLNGTSSSPSAQTRAASTTIFYFLTPNTSFGVFHRNKARIIHTLHRGRGRYVLIHADEVEKGQRARIETFVVGQDLSKGERLQWIVEGGKYKASYLLDDEEGSSGSEGLLISEVGVVHL